MDAAAAGLEKVAKLGPSHGYLETLAGVAMHDFALEQAHARLSSELGWKINPSHSLFARTTAELGSHPDLGVDVGWRWTW